MSSTSATNRGRCVAATAAVPETMTILPVSEHRSLSSMRVPPRSLPSCSGESGESASGATATPKQDKRLGAD
jgi:hypothetical protein